MQLPEWSNGIGKHMLKIEDGKSVTGNIRGDLVRFYQHWKGGRSMICPGRDTCAMCASTVEEERKATGRFRVNFITKTAPHTAMVFEGGKRVYDQLIQLNKDVPLEKAWVRVSRTGTKQNTQFMLAIVPGDGGMLKPAEEKEIFKVELLDISLEDADEADEPVSEG